MSLKYFGTDGIRGKAFMKLNSNIAFKLGQAIAKKYNSQKIIIGQDTRQSSGMLAYGVAYGAALAGVDVLIAGIVSTPMVAYYSKVKKIIGVMITASHNPYTDNGIKIIKSGYKMLDEEELELEHFMDEPSIKQSNIFGSITMTDEVESIYSKVYNDLNIPMTDLKITYDSANGANYKISKRVIERYANESYQIGNQPDGVNINLNVGSTYLDSIKEAMKLHKSDIGLSFDGDGDRLLVVDGEGILYDGDMIVYIIAKYLKSINKLNKNTVVLTQMSNPGIIKAFNNLGIKVSQTPVGDKYVSEEIMKHNYTIGGENSGHIIINDLLPSGDGLFAGIYLIKTLTENHMNLKDYTKEVEMYPQHMVNIKNIDKEVLKDPEILKLIDTVKEDLTEDSLLLVRPSGTEPLVHVAISCQDILELDKYMGLLVTKIQNLGSLNK